LSLASHLSEKPLACKYLQEPGSPWLSPVAAAEAESRISPPTGAAMRLLKPVAILATEGISATEGASTSTCSAWFAVLLG